MCNKPIGKQDQYAAAYGGLNYMTFDTNGVTVSPIPMSNEHQKYLNDYLMLFYLGTAPPSGDILQEQEAHIHGQDNFTVTSMHRMKELTRRLYSDLRIGRFDRLGRCLHINWEHKRALTPSITNSKIDDYYEMARNAGAIGGKVCGAGGGGFMLFFAQPKRHAAIKKALPLKFMPIAPEMNGARVVHMTGLDD
jgi:D-glycero-alpha-D-manno-heptose-7-phosphate kinase